MRVLLFDIDGTLVSVDGAGRRAFVRAATAVYGAVAGDALAELRFDGMTDALILRHTCAAIGRTVEPADATTVFALYETALREELASCRHRVHAGVPRLLETLARTPALIGLGTGNVRAGAMAKLARAGLEHHFAFGGFGDDGETREAILAAAIARAREHGATAVAREDVVVIGDTPRDVEAARALGCRGLGVATGRFGRSELLRAGAHHAVDSLEEVGVLEALLGSDMLPAP